MYHLYVIETAGRDDLQAFLNGKGITALTNYPIAIHQQEGFPFGAGDPKPVLPETEKNAANCLTLPIYPELTEEEVEDMWRRTCWSGRTAPAPNIPGAINGVEGINRDNAKVRKRERGPGRVVLFRDTLVPDRWYRRPTGNGGSGLSAFCYLRRNTTRRAAPQQGDEN